MQKQIIYSLTEDFESHDHQSTDGVEFWMARDVQHLLGYVEWRNFNLVISKSKTACEVSEQLITDHFVDVNKTIQMPKGAEKEMKIMVNDKLSMINERLTTLTTNHY